MDDEIGSSDITTNAPSVRITPVFPPPQYLLDLFPEFKPRRERKDKKPLPETVPPPTTRSSTRTANAAAAAAAGDAPSTPTPRPRSSGRSTTKTTTPTPQPPPGHPPGPDPPPPPPPPNPDEVYTHLEQLLSKPSAVLTLHALIPLPRSLFSRSSSPLPPSRGTITHLDFPAQTAHISLHPDSQHTLAAAFDAFLATYPNRYVPTPIRAHWLARFQSSMATLSVTAPTDQLLRRLDWKHGSAAGNLGALLGPTVQAKVQALFSPGGGEPRNIWEIPYHVEPGLRGTFRTHEPRPGTDAVHVVTAVGGTAEIRKLRPPLDDDVEPEPPPPPPKRRKRAPAEQPRPPHRFVALQIGVNETGGKAAVRQYAGTPELADTVHPKYTYNSNPPGSYPTPPADLAGSGGSSGGGGGGGGGGVIMVGGEPLGIKSGNLGGGMPTTPAEEVGCGF